jgi:hypothetical protein
MALHTRPDTDNSVTKQQWQAYHSYSSVQQQQNANSRNNDYNYLIPITPTCTQK